MVAGKRVLFINKFIHCGTAEHGGRHIKVSTAFINRGTVDYVAANRTLSEWWGILKLLLKLFLNIATLHLLLYFTFCFHSIFVLFLFREQSK